MWIVDDGDGSSSASGKPARVALLIALWWSVSCCPRPVAARSLEATLAGTFPPALRDDGEGLAHVFAATVAGTFPVTGTSTSFVYRFDPTIDALRRLDVPLGPVFSERAETVGEGGLSIGVTYLLARYDAINGRDLDFLLSNDPTKPGAHIELPAVPVAEPVAGIARIDLEAQIAALSATYGASPDLDVNVFVPLVRTFLRAQTTFISPDPRAPPDPRFFGVTQTNRATEDATGVGDVLLRLKQALLHSYLVDVAGGLVLSLPTGSRPDFQGTGDAIVGGALYASHSFAGRIQPHVNLTFVADPEKFDRSQLRYSAGADLRVCEWLTLNNDFLGRSDIARPDRVNRPVFVQIERSDVLQFSTGLKTAPPWRESLFGRGLSSTLFVNALLPLNEDGVRAEHVLSFGVEAVF